MASTAALGVGLLAGLAPVPSSASSHREAPLVAADPQVDNTDVYAFVSPDRPNTTTLISSWIPFETPAGGPNFYSFATDTNYDIRIDNNGDSNADLVYRWRFTNHYRNKETFLYNTGQVTSLKDKDLNFYQTYKLYRMNVGGGSKVVSQGVVAPSFVGDASMPNYNTLFNQAIDKGKSGTMAFTGQSDDPFFLDLRVFDLLYGANLSEVGNDTLAGFNVNTLAVQVPNNLLANKGNATKHPIIGVWSTASRPSMRIQKSNGNQSFKGKNVQVSRLGMPLVNEVVIPVGDKDKWNGSKPSNDGQFLKYVTKPELPKLIQAIYGIPAPATPRNDLVSVFLTGVAGLNQPKNVTPSEMLRLNMSIPPCTSGCSRLGVIGGDLGGYPNGRRLADDTIDISLRVVEGVLDPNHPAVVDTLGDGVDTNDVPFQNSFPYVALPHSGSAT